MKCFALSCLMLPLLAVGTLAFGQPAEEPEIKVEMDRTQRFDLVTIDGHPFFEVIRGETERFGPTAQPFIYPIIGPTGASMTRNYPMRKNVPGESKDHPHHRSLWFAHGNVNGIDFWHGRNARITTQNPVNNLYRLETSEAGFTNWVLDRNQWIGPHDEVILLEESGYRPDVLVDGTRIIDIRHHMTPGPEQEQVTFGETKEGTMAIRLHPALRLKGPVATGRCVNSEGDTDGDCWGKRAKWVAYWGEIDGQTCGVAVFDHPTNLRHPTWWHARDYGLVAANPFGIHDFDKTQPRGSGDYTLEAGQTLTLHYRFVFFAGTAEEADIAGKYEAWVAETTAAEEEEEEEEE